jgi:hypothetical protein
MTGGPADVVAGVQPDDVEAVIEMKAAPSTSFKNKEAFAADIRKLDDLRAKNSHIQCYFVLIDKSLPVPGATCDAGKYADECWLIGPHERLQESVGENLESFVEIWDLGCTPDPAPRLRYWV